MTYNVHIYVAQLLHLFRIVVALFSHVFQTISYYFHMAADPGPGLGPLGPWPTTCEHNMKYMWTLCEIHVKITCHNYFALCSHLVHIMLAFSSHYVRIIIAHISHEFCIDVAYFAHLSSHTFYIIWAFVVCTHIYLISIQLML